MEGVTHASTGFLLGAGIGLLVTASHAHAVPWYDGLGRDLLYGLVTSGAALLCDADHPKASFAYAAGWLSHGISHIIAAVFGGHRQGFHSVFGVALMSLITASCSVWWPNHWSLGFLAALLAICITAGLRATGFARRGPSALIVGCVIAGLAVYAVRPSLWWLVALGMALHITEDMLTGHGVGLLWPITNRRYGGDGHQPAKRRSGRKPKSGYQKARDRALRGPAAPKPPAGPARSSGKGAISMCISCMAKNCGECKGQGCRCPQPDTSHPARKTARRKPVSAELPDEPPF